MFFPCFSQSDVHPRSVRHVFLTAQFAPAITGLYQRVRACWSFRGQMVRAVTPFKAPGISCQRWGCLMLTTTVFWKTKRCVKWHRRSGHTDDLITDHEKILETSASPKTMGTCMIYYILLNYYLILYMSYWWDATHHPPFQKVRDLTQALWPPIYHILSYITTLLKNYKHTG